MRETLYLQRLQYDKPKELATEFPFSIQPLDSLNEVSFEKSVSFIIGENGTGKSTIIETIAVLMGLNAEGGSKNNLFESYEEPQQLADYCRPIRYPNYPRDAYFYRAESFFNLMTDIEFVTPDMYEKKLHHYSRGESLKELIKTRFFGHGFYVMDEPETGLSLTSQLELLVLIDQLVKENSQFIISTHSPILLLYPEADIFELSDGKINKKSVSETKLYQEWEMIFQRKEQFIDKLLH